MPDLILQQYQILIAGCLGFTGVILTVFANGLLNRRQHSRETKQKVNSIRAALKSELEINYLTFQARIDEFEQPKDVNAYLPAIVFINVYKSLISEIGLLNEHEVKNVIKAYLLVEELPNIAQLYFLPHNDGFICIEPGMRKTVSQLHKDRLKAINTAIESLK